MEIVTGTEFRTRPAEKNEERGGWRQRKPATGFARYEKIFKVRKTVGIKRQLAAK